MKFKAELQKRLYFCYELGKSMKEIKAETADKGDLGIVAEVRVRKAAT